MPPLLQAAAPHPPKLCAHTNAFWRQLPCCLGQPLSWFPAEEEEHTSTAPGVRLPPALEHPGLPAQLAPDGPPGGEGGNDGLMLQVGNRLEEEDPPLSPKRLFPPRARLCDQATFGGETGCQGDAPEPVEARLGLRLIA